MNGNEVVTAVRLKLNIVWIINVNEQLGMIHYELRKDETTDNSTLSKLNYAENAISMGARGEFCENINDLPELIRIGLKSDLPTVIHVNVDPDALPPMGLKKKGSVAWKKYIDEI